MPRIRGRLRRLQWATDAILSHADRPDISDGEVWYVIPSASAERCSKAFAEWKKMGYHTCVIIDRGAERPSDADLVVEPDGPYKGYFTSVNEAAKMLVREHGARVVVAGGDDMFPDPKRRATDVASEYFVRFPDGIGVMQPVGDMLPGTLRICGSPWFGAAWVMRGYNGHGAFWPGYFQFGGDVELRSVSRGLGLLWQRSDLVQFHDHYTRRGAPYWSNPDHPEIAPHQRANLKCYASRDWEEYCSRRAAGWPEHQPGPA